MPSYSKIMAEWYKLQNTTTMSVTEAAEVSHKEQELIHTLTECYNTNNKPYWDYIFSPYFTESECDQFAIELESMTPENRRINKPMFYIEPNKFKPRIKDLETRLKSTEDPDEIEDIQNQMKAYGWNPEIEFNDANQELANRRLMEHYDEELSQFYFIDAISEVASTRDLERPEKYNMASPYNIFTCGNITYTGIGDIIDKDIAALNKINKTEGCIYTIFIENSDIMYRPTVHWHGYPYVGFDIPSNVMAARTAKALYEFMELPILTKTPIIKKVYEGKFELNKVLCVNAFNHAVNSSNMHVYSEVDHTSLAIDPAAFFSMNLLSDQS